MMKLHKGTPRKAWIGVAALATLAAGCGGSSSGSSSPPPTPSINSITPNPVTRGQSLSITGTNLNGTGTIAFFFPVAGGVSGEAVATSGNSTSVNVLVPTTLAAGSFNLYVQTTNSAGASPDSNTESVTLQ